jgi:Zn-dependent metalloprotease
MSILAERIFSVPGIIPPFILERAAKKGNEKQKDAALKTLMLSETFRGQRQVLGKIAPTLMLSPGEKQRSIYDTRYKKVLPGKLARNEGQAPVTDLAINQAYDGAGSTYDFYFNLFKRNSLDNNGMRMISTVHYAKGYDNAFWTGRQMVYGDGSGNIFKVGSFTSSLDVIAHEMTHGVTDFTAGLNYEYQSGALNESFSDVIGILIKQFVLNLTADKSDWLIGPGMWADSISGVAIRSMKEPGTAYNDPVIGKDPQPGHWKDYVNTDDDEGGVHINSGIPNHAFYLAATGLGGYAWEKAGKIWYVTLRDILKPDSQFKDAADATINVAGNLFGADGVEQRIVRDAWNAVGYPFL